jgi:uncharacterized protein DUF4411
VRYSVDTSALLDAWARWYKIGQFPTLWQKVDALIASGEMIATEAVLWELEKQSDDLHAWVKARPKLFIPLGADVQSVAKQILSQFPRLVDTRKGRNPADPFVIGLSMVNGIATVTGEHPTGKQNRPNIPDVCAHFGIKWIGFPDVIAEQKWQF